MLILMFFGGFPGGSNGKESTCNAGDPDSIPGSGRFPGKWQPTPVFLPGRSPERGAWQAAIHGAAKESDMTEQTNTFTFTLILF